MSTQQHSEADREQLLYQSQRALIERDRALGIVSHELRSALSTIEMCTSALLEPDPASIEGVRHMARIIQRSSALMRQIVQDLVDRASLDAGHLVLERKPTLLSDVFASARAMFEPVAAGHRLDFIVESSSDLPRVDADPARLLQVLTNLLGNAMKFTPTGGRVVLSALPFDSACSEVGLAAAAGREAVRVAVSDTGPGISRDELPHVFDWFWQAKPGACGGVGLGLAIARGLVEAHGRILHVESTLGRGSVFWFTLAAERRVERIRPSRVESN
ncbi:MAG TPA: HAMP domain-containing sensor histidine kinase [Gemmatimonadaceae bacterium]|nr:HAMP domain-containing sensor histidine kinase [Gemmatimonadaceae bacterium]